METWQLFLILLYGLGGLLASFWGYRKCKVEKNNLGLVGIFTIYGGFVWADLVVFGIFWALFSFYSIATRDVLLFALGQSIFWFVRSLGETIYWFNQQFSPINRNPMEKYFMSKIFNNDDYTSWFFMQITYQCICVVSAILSIYFARLWLLSL